MEGRDSRESNWGRIAKSTKDGLLSSTAPSVPKSIGMAGPSRDNGVGVREENKGFYHIFNCTLSLRQAWATLDPVLKRKRVRGKGRGSKKHR